MEERNIYKELFRLVRKYGEKLVIINPENDEAVVVLRHDEYQKICSTIASRKDNHEINSEISQHQQNFSFWDTKEEKDKKLDNTQNNGRIDELVKEKEGINSSEYTTEFETVHDKSFEDAGGGYMFEPEPGEEEV